MMTSDQAEAFLREYRATLKTWSLIGAGIAAGDGAELYRQLIAGRATLLQIAQAYPEHTYSASLLEAATRNPLELG